MMALAILVGLALIFFGRQLFWLFVGGVGFAAGLSWATEFFHGQSDTTVLVVAIVAGLLGALLAVVLQKFAIAVAGFFAGTYLLLNFATRVGNPDWGWVAALIGGVVGAMLVLVLFDWALIVLSSATGALLVADNLGLSGPVLLLGFVVLALAGMAAQSAQLRRAVPRPPPTPVESR